MGVSLYTVCDEWLIMSKGLEWMRNEAVVAYFKVMLRGLKELIKTTTNYNSSLG
jgi:hypothetical protein